MQYNTVDCVLCYVTQYIWFCNINFRFFIYMYILIKWQSKWLNAVKVKKKTLKFRLLLDEIALKINHNLLFVFRFPASDNSTELCYHYHNQVI